MGACSPFGRIRQLIATDHFYSPIVAFVISILSSDLINHHRFLLGLHKHDYREPMLLGEGDRVPKRGVNLCQVTLPLGDDQRPRKLEQLRQFVGGRRMMKCEPSLVKWLGVDLLGSDNDNEGPVDWAHSLLLSRWQRPLISACKRTAR